MILLAAGSILTLYGSMMSAGPIIDKYWRFVVSTAVLASDYCHGWITFVGQWWCAMADDGSKGIDWTIAVVNVKKHSDPKALMNNASCWFTIVPDQSYFPNS